MTCGAHIQKMLDCPSEWTRATHVHSAHLPPSSPSPVSPPLHTPSAATAAVQIGCRTDLLSLVEFSGRSAGSRVRKGSTVAAVLACILRDMIPAPFGSIPAMLPYGCAIIKLFVYVSCVLLVNYRFY